MSLQISRRLICDFPFHNIRDSSSSKEVRWEVVNYRAYLVNTSNLTKCDDGGLHACEFCGEMLIQTLTKLDMKFSVFQPKYSGKWFPSYGLGAIRIS